jgi:hypothetical protein
MISFSHMVINEGTVVVWEALWGFVHISGTSFGHF